MMKTTTHFLFTLLLTFLVGSTAAWAGSQVIPTLSTDGNIHYYTIKNTRTNKYLYWNSDKGFILQSSTPTENSYFYFTAGTATTDVNGVTVLKIHNASTTNLMADFQSWTSTGIDWYVKAASNGNSTGIAFSKSTSYGNTEDSWNSYDSDNKVGPYKIDGGSLFEVEEATTLKQVTNQILKPLLDKYASLIGKPFSCTQAAYDNLQTAYNQYNTEDALTTDALTAIRTARTTFLTSNPVTEIANNTTVIFGNLKYSDQYVYTTTNSLGASANKDSYAYEWILKKQDNGYFKIYNPYQNKYVGSIPTIGGWNHNGDDEAIPLVEDVNAAQDYAIIATNQFGYVNIHSTQSGLGENRSYWHMGNNGNIVRWEAANENSHFQFITDVASIESDWDAAIKKRATSYNSTNVGTYNTNIIAEPLSTFTAATTSEAKGAAYKALETAIASARILPEAGKYYTISNADHEGKYIVEKYGETGTLGGTALYCQSLEANTVPALWQFEQCTDNGKTDLYFIKAANSGQYMSRVQWQESTLYMSVLDKSSNDVGRFDIFNKDHVRKSNAVTLVYYTNDNRTDRGTARVNSNEGEGKIESWNDNADGNNFLIQEVTEIPVTISAAGYATLNLPMAVNIPEGVKAYTGTESEDEIKLTEITSGIIPAETPVILEGTGSETPYKFTIAYGNTDAALTTALKGTLTPTTIADDATAYILKNGGQGIGLYKVTSTTDREIKANKAYYGSTTGSEAAPVLLFNFGQTTGIHSSTNATSTAASETNVYFDLQGRRIPCPAHGIFVKANGEKVFIK